MVIPVLHDEITPVPLTLFMLGQLQDVKSRTQYRPIYSPLTRSYGDNQPQPTVIQFTGIVHGNSFAEMMDKRDTYLAAGARGEQWLQFWEGGMPYARQLRVGRLLNKSSNWIEQKSMRVIELSMELELIAPFWQSQAPNVLVEELVEGANVLQLTNAGSRTTFPEITVTGSDVTEVIISSNDRSLHYASDTPLGGMPLLVDCLRGITRFGSVPANPDIQDGSLFPNLPAGSHDFSIELVGGSGTVTIVHRDAWEL